MPASKFRGKGILVILIFCLGVFTLCLFFGIFSTIPAKTADIYGPPDLDLPFLKSIRQSVILILAEDALTKTQQREGEEQIYIVQEGDSLDTILSGMQDLGLVQHPEAFRAYLIYAGIDTRIQPGEYMFSPTMSELEIAEGLGDPASLRVNISILPGWRVEEIAASLEGLGLALSTQDLINQAKEGQKEGYLSPGSYKVERDITSAGLIDLLYQGFISNITPELEASLEAQGLSLQEGVILASIVEREAILDEELPLIASVFLNRIDNDINLAADPTVQYAVGYSAETDTWWKNPLSLDDLQIHSPYNTYEYPGLPPGPICNPSLAALKAVASPQITSFLYFRAACDNSGRHLFAETYDDHLNNACQD